MITSEIASRSPGHRARALGDLGEPLAAILTIAAWPDEAIVTNGASLADEITDFARQQPHDVIPLLLATLRAPTSLSDTALLSKNVRYDDSLIDLANGCAARLRVLLGRPQRAAGDWSIPLPAGGCTCDLCSTLKAFLASPAKRTFDWPLRKDDRHHIHSRIDAAELPVTHVTRRMGRPYTLVLTKTDSLFDTERQAEAQNRADLDWLAIEWTGFPGPPPRE
jgi:hypothetical protein